MSGLVRKCLQLNLSRKTSLVRTITQRQEMVKRVSQEIVKENPPKRVTFSMAVDVWENMALEEWLYTKETSQFSKENQLLLYQNKPCVVIGRHQNPYAEANLDYLAQHDIPLVRRYSGGGAVFHDLGNLNMTFFTSKENYNRKWNLNLICEVLRNEYNIEATINEKDDIIVEGRKVSGSAAKLDREKAYHHCTLLVMSNLDKMSTCLQNDENIDSKATKSIPSKVANLCEFNHKVNVHDLKNAIACAYLNRSCIEGDDTLQMDQSNGSQYTNPDDDWLPGFDSMKVKLKSWDWVYGRTPKFTVQPKLALGTPTLHATKGVIEEVTGNLDASVLCGLNSRLKGQRYHPDLLHDYKIPVEKKVQKPRVCDPTPWNNV